MKKIKGLVFILIAIIIIAGVVLFVLNNDVKIKEYNNDDIELVYDSTWKLVDNKEFKLKHKKSKSTFTIAVKELDSNYYDTSLNDMIKDIVYDIQTQNKVFILIDNEENIRGYGNTHKECETQAKIQQCESFAILENK